MYCKTAEEIFVLNSPTIEHNSSHQNADPKKTPPTKLKDSWVFLISIVRPVKSAIKSKIVAGFVSVRKKVVIYACNNPKEVQSYFLQ